MVSQVCLEVRIGATCITTCVCVAVYGSVLGRTRTCVGML